MNTPIPVDLNRQHYRRAIATITIVLIACTLYGAVRYNVLQGISWHEFPLWTMNKVFSMAAMILAALAAVSGLGKNKVVVYTSQLWHAVLWTTCIHAGMSFVLLSPERYPWFYVTPTLNGSTLNGFYAFSFALSITALTILLLRRGRRYTFTSSFLILFLAPAHITLLGLMFWFNKFTWPAGLPPVSLIAVAAGCIALLAITWSRFFKKM